MGKNSTLENLKNKLKGYSALAGAVIASGSAANADVLVNNTTVALTNDGESFEIDLNCDGTADARVTFNESNATNYVASYTFTSFSNKRSAAMTLMGASAMTSTTASGTFMGGYVSNGVAIGGANAFSNGMINTLIGRAASYGGYVTTGLTQPWATTGMSTGIATYLFKQQGAWGNGVPVGLNKYMGLRMEIPASSGNFFYGWAKISTQTGGLPSSKLEHITIHRYALSDVANTDVLAGNVAGIADSASAITVSDVSDNDNASDLSVSFTLTDTTKTGAIRLFAVPVGGDTLDKCDAWGALASNYLSVDVTSGSGTGPFTYNVNFTGQTDINGNPIVNGQDYVVYVYTRGNGTTANQSVLMKSSNSVTLFGQAEPITTLAVADISDNDDASDLQVTFNEPASDVSKQDTYRIFVVKSAKAASFDNDSANAVMVGNYKTEMSTGTGAAKTINYTAGDKDTDGDNIVVCTDYKVFVQSVANQTTADRDALVGPSGVITLKGVVDTAQNIMSSDIDDQMNGADLEFTFDAPADPSGITEYRVIAVPTASLPITLSAAEAVSIGGYVNVTESASPSYSGSFVNKTDYSGAPIQNNIDYTVCVLAMNDGVCVDKNAISFGSSGTTLTTVIPAEVDNMTIVAVDTADDRKPSDMHVTFAKPTDTNGIGSYHIVVVNSFNAAFFAGSNGESYVTKNMLKQGYLTKVTPSMVEADNMFRVRLAPYQLDENGEIITNYKSYNVFILSEGDGVISLSNSLSDSSAQVILRDYTGIANDLEGMVSINAYENNVRIVLDPSVKLAGSVTLHNSLGQVIYNENIHSREMLMSNIKENGIFFVTVIVGDQKITKKVFINR